jgi:hypothetical protein
MKIRIKGNFVRYRLSQTDVSTLANTGHLVETTCFGPTDEQTFRYALKTRDDATELLADFADGCITLYLPTAIARAWPDEERVGFENQILVAPGITLHLLLEKDFTCLDETVEDQSDNYPNPLAEYQSAISLGN